MTPEEYQAEIERLREQNSALRRQVNQAQEERDGEYRNWSGHLKRRLDELCLSSDPRAREISLAMEREIAKGLGAIAKTSAHTVDIVRGEYCRIEREPVVLVRHIWERIAELRRRRDAPKA